MILRIDDTDVERNTEASLQSIYEGLRWLDLGWDEEYKQSERLALHRAAAQAIFDRGLAYRDFTPAHTGDSEKSGAQGTWLFNADMRDLPAGESDRRAAAGEPFALRYRVPREAGRQVAFADGSTWTAQAPNGNAAMPNAVGGVTPCSDTMCHRRSAPLGGNYFECNQANGKGCSPSGVSCITNPCAVPGPLLPGVVLSAN